jgi:hypothetical protein
VNDGQGHYWCSTAHSCGGGGRRRLQVEDVFPADTEIAADYNDLGSTPDSTPGERRLDDPVEAPVEAPVEDVLAEIVTDGPWEKLDCNHADVPCKLPEADYGAVDATDGSGVGGRALQEDQQGGIPTEFEPDKYNCESKGNAGIINAANAAGLVFPEDAKPTNAQLIHCCLKN